MENVEEVLIHIKEVSDCHNPVSLIARSQLLLDVSSVKYLPVKHSELPPILLRSITIYTKTGNVPFLVETDRVS